MQRFASVAFAFICGAFFAAASSSSVSAQTSRVWVSGLGSDTANCSRETPCKTFSAANQRLASDGVIGALDSHGFGGIIITKPMTVDGGGTLAGVLTAGTNGFTINAPGAHVRLVGLSFDGIDTGLAGVSIIDAAQVTIERCRIFNFKGSLGAGVRVSSASKVRVTIRDSFISGNTVGIDLAPTGAGSHTVMLDNVTVDASEVANIRAERKKSAVILRRSTVFGSPILLTGGAELKSFGDNAIGGAQATTEFKLR